MVRRGLHPVVPHLQLSKGRCPFPWSSQVRFIGVGDGYVCHFDQHARQPSLQSYNHGVIGLYPCLPHILRIILIVDLAKPWWGRCDSRWLWLLTLTQELLFTPSLQPLRVFLWPLAWSMSSLRQLWLTLPLTSLAPPRYALPDLCIWWGSPGCVPTFPTWAQSQHDSGRVISSGVLFLLNFWYSLGDGSWLLLVLASPFLFYILPLPHVSLPFPCPIGSHSSISIYLYVF